MTPLHLASKYERPSTVHLLLEHGASVEAEDGQGRIPFQTALAEGHLEVTKLLSKDDAENKSSRSASPLPSSGYE